MKVSYNWLKDYVDIKDQPSELAYKLTMAGLEAHEEKIGGEPVFEIEITSNRPDWLSHLGIAREISALGGNELALPALASVPTGKINSRISVRVDDKKACPFYTYSIVENISIKKSFSRISSRLAGIGERSINCIVDITNYVLFEWGQPMHAFDLDKLKQRSGSDQVELFVRFARQNETITTIDAVKRMLCPDILVIADKLGPVAVAGVMGGMDTQVDSETRSIVLESAYFEPVTVRKSRQKLGLTSESSYRFERSVVMEDVLRAHYRARELLSEFSPSSVFSTVGKKGSFKAKKSHIVLSENEINSLLGTRISISRAKDILKRLGFSAKIAGKARLSVTVPAFRQDVRLKEDLIEEVARIYGYNNIQPLLPRLCVSKQFNVDKQELLLEKAKQVLFATGFQEALTYSLVSRDRLYCKDEKTVIAVVNPLSKEQACLRPALLPGLLTAAAYNFNHFQTDLRLFESGTVFETFSQGGVREIPRLALVCYGDAIRDWLRKPKLKQAAEVGFFDIKGVAESILKRAGIEAVDIKAVESELFEPGNCGVMFSGSDQLAVLGRISERVLKDYGIRKQAVFACEFDLSRLLKQARLGKAFKDLSNLPSSTRDVTFSVDESVSVGDIRQTVKEKNIPFLVGFKLSDEYRGEQVERGKKSLSFTCTFYSKEKTLTQEEVEKSLEEVRKVLNGRFKLILRS